MTLTLLGSTLDVPLGIGAISLGRSHQPVVHKASKMGISASMVATAPMMLRNGLMAKRKTGHPRRNVPLLIRRSLLEFDGQFFSGLKLHAIDAFEQLLSFGGTFRLILHKLHEFVLLSD